VFVNIVDLLVLLVKKSLDELEKLVSIVREKRDDERKKLRSDYVPPSNGNNESPLQQLAIAQTSLSLTNIQINPIVETQEGNL
jgi:hypothetical protein